MSHFHDNPEFLADLRALCQGSAWWVRWLSDADGDMPGRYDPVPWENEIWVHDPLAALGFVEARVCNDPAQEQNGKKHVFLTPRGKRVLSGAMAVLDFDNKVGAGLINILFAIKRHDLGQDPTAMALFEAGKPLSRTQRIEIILQIMSLPKR